MAGTAGWCQQVEGLFLEWHLNCAQHWAQLAEQLQEFANKLRPHKFTAAVLLLQMHTLMPTPVRFFALQSCSSRCNA